jgi:hypothetical protein
LFEQTGVAGTVSQKKPEAQPLLVAFGAVPTALHAVSHAVPEAHAKSFGQAAAVAALHVPLAPLHVSCGLSDEPVHIGPFPQAVPTDLKPHAPLALQVPLLQSPADDVHELFGLVPAVTFAHAPAVPPVSAARHDWQPPAQVMSQQTVLP